MSEWEDWAWWISSERERARIRAIKDRRARREELEKSYQSWLDAKQKRDRVGIEPPPIYDPREDEGPGPLFEGVMSNPIASPFTSGERVLDDELLDHVEARIRRLSRSTPQARAAAGDFLRVDTISLTPFWGTLAERRAEPWRKELLRAWLEQGDPSALRWAVRDATPGLMSYGSTAPTDDLELALDQFLGRLNERQWSVIVRRNPKKKRKKGKKKGRSSDALSQVKWLLEQNDAKLVRSKKHLIYKIKGKTIGFPKTASDPRSWKNALTSLKRLLRELAAEGHDVVMLNPPRGDERIRELERIERSPEEQEEYIRLLELHGELGRLEEHVIPQTLTPAERYFYERSGYGWSAFDERRRGEMARIEARIQNAKMLACAEALGDAHGIKFEVVEVMSEDLVDCALTRDGQIVLERDAPTSQAQEPRLLRADMLLRYYAPHELHAFVMQGRCGSPWDKIGIESIRQAILRRRIGFNPPRGDQRIRELERKQRTPEEQEEYIRLLELHGKLEETVLARFNLNEAERYMYEWAGWSHPAGADAIEQIEHRVRNAVDLAWAEREAEERGWVFGVEYDWSLSHMENYEDFYYVVSLYEGEPIQTANHLATVTAIGGENGLEPNYERVIEADLAWEWLSTLWADGEIASDQLTLSDHAFAQRRVRSNPCPVCVTTAVATAAGAAGAAALAGGALKKRKSR